MKKLLLLFVLLTSFSNRQFGQAKTYITSGLEIIFSWGDVNHYSKSETSALRFAPVVNLQSFIQRDFNEHLGVFSGLAVRNVGYIYKDFKYAVPNSTVVISQDKKFRSYNIGIPVGIKLGNLSKLFVYGGYELEIPIQYKEKTFENGDKVNKITGWFSNRQQSVYNSVFFGLQFPYGTNLKFKYYLTDFHNKGYTAADGSKPYAGLTTNVFYVSLCSMLFRNAEFDPDQRD